MVEYTIDVEVVAPLEPAPDAERLERAVRHVLLAEGVEEAEISVALLDDGDIARLNEQYLGHTGATDVISFPLHAGGEAPLGDVYVGAEQAARQAAELGVPLDEELLRLVIHGTLHVLGYDHPDSDEERAGSPMYRRQEALLAEVIAAGREPG